jgi:hypothetical protein
MVTDEANEEAIKDGNPIPAPISRMFFPAMI